MCCNIWSKRQTCQLLQFYYCPPTPVGAVPSSLISQQWEGDFQKIVITISSNETGVLTSTHAVTYCPTAARLVPAVTFPKSPVQFGQL